VAPVYLRWHPRCTDASVSVTFAPEGEGRFHGTMTLPSIGSCRLALSWQDARASHIYTFTVPVTVGHH
jgi:hypothetical protein